MRTIQAVARAHNRGNSRSKGAKFQLLSFGAAPTRTTATLANFGILRLQLMDHGSVAERANERPRATGLMLFAS
jgi:hypothetical protein